VNAVEASDLHTETFSNARGWIAVRVTHGPTGVAVERKHTSVLRSAVQAQKECFEEIQLLLAEGESSAPSTGGPERVAKSARRSAPGVPRSEFDRLAARVAFLEERLAEIAARVPDGG
jgi:hypothetical protein